MGDLDSAPGLERSSGGGHGNPFQYSCLENSMDREMWWATVHSITELDMTGSDLARTCTEALLSYFHMNLFNPQKSPYKLGSFMISVLHGQDPKHRGLST